MSFLYDVAVPEMALSGLTYECPVEIQTGVRVIGEVKKHLHAGFILGLSNKNLSDKIKIKKIEGIIDEKNIIPSDLWDMALYAGRVCLCGAGAALKAILPRPLIMGDKLKAPPEIFYKGKFSEIDFFNPFDAERVNFYMNEIKSEKRTLILFPRKEQAKNFFENLDENIKNQTLLWPSTGGKKLWLSWILTNEKKFRLVIGTAGAVFAPLSPEKIIIENEADGAFIIPPVLNISARSLAGRRAAFLGAEFITGGNIPSLKTFVRSKPQQEIFIDKKNLILADIFHSKTKNEELKGIKGSLPLTFSLIKNTYRELSKNNNVLWILDRLGEASEVFCENCGGAVKCSKCGQVMRSEDDGKILRCRICGQVQELPSKCENCGGEFFTGKRPGLEALEKIAKRYYDKVYLYADKYSRFKKNSLILSTKKGLGICGKINPSLIAWLDLDLELWRPGYDTRVEVFNMLWQSYWRGREENSARKVLIQSRKSGMKLARFLYSGWEKFFSNELKTRKEFNLPPYGYIIEIETQDTKLRETLLDNLFNAGIFVMDPGDETQPLYINTNSLDPVEKVLHEFRNKNKSFFLIRS